MKKNFMKSSLFMSFTMFITGCSVANLDTSYNPEKKITYLELGTDKTYVIPNSEKLTTKNSSHSINKSRMSFESFISNGVCDRFVLRKLPPLGRNQYYTTQAKQDVYGAYGKSRCSTQEINGLEFHDCNYIYVISYDSNNEEGFLTEKRFFETRSEQCFEDIKRNVRGTSSSEVEKKVYLDQSYSGIFATTTLGNEKCTDGRFEAKVVDKNLNGAFFYKNKELKNKKISFSVDLQPDNKFKFDSPLSNIKINGKLSFDNKFIGGSYKNGNCAGAFEASRF